MYLHPRILCPNSPKFTCCVCTGLFPGLSSQDQPEHWLGGKARAAIGGVRHGCSCSGHTRAHASRCRAELEGEERGGQEPGLHLHSGSRPYTCSGEPVQGQRLESESSLPSRAALRLYHPSSFMEKSPHSCAHYPSIPTQFTGSSAK